MYLFRKTSVSFCDDLLEVQEGSLKSTNGQLCRIELPQAALRRYKSHNLNDVMIREMIEPFFISFLGKSIRRERCWLTP